MSEDAIYGGLSREALQIIGSIGSVIILSAIALLFKRVRYWVSRLPFRVSIPHYPQRRDAEQNREIYMELVELRALAESDRSYVLRFHNGAEFLPSHPAWKVTCTHEVVKHGVTYESAKLQGLLVSRVPNIIEPVITGSSSNPGVEVVQCPECPYQEQCVKSNKRVLVIQVDQMGGSYCKFHLESQNIKTVIVCGLAKNGNVYGMVGVDYCDAKRSDLDRLREQIQRVCRSAEKIQYLLDFKKAPSDPSRTSVPSLDGK